MLLIGSKNIFSITSTTFITSGSSSSSFFNHIKTYCQLLCLWQLWQHPYYGNYGNMAVVAILAIEVYVCIDMGV